MIRTAMLSAALLSAVFAAALVAAPAFAADEYNTSTGTTVEGQRVALRGQDAVALATGLTVVTGEAVFTHVHDGVAYYFASEANRDVFAADPASYMPKFGGFCALGVGLGKKLDGDTRYADIVDGKLYLFLNAAVFETYKKDRAGWIAKAETSWPRLHHMSVDDANGLTGAKG